MALEIDVDPSGSSLSHRPRGPPLSPSPLSQREEFALNDHPAPSSSLSEAERLMSSFVVVPDGELTSTLLATANIGSIFEAPSELIPEWTRQVVEKIKRLQPQFIALHCQEVGGKNFEESMKYVDGFVKDFINRGHELGYTRIVAFFDKNFEASDKFTALGSIYLVHKSVQYVEIYNFQKRSFESPCGHHMHLGCIDAQPLVEKHKFPLYLFPDNRWSRKGFLRTRWRINGTILDLINIHLFHDASNLVSFESDPCVYVNYRRRALQYTLDLIQDDDKQSVPFIIFGDFNFRLDSQRVLARLIQEESNDCSEQQMQAPNPRSSASTPNQLLVTSNSLNNVLLSPRSEAGRSTEDLREFRNREDKLVLSLGKKEFALGESYECTFNTDWKEWASLDKETASVSNRLTEFPINFPPTYPFEEKPSLSSRYMKTRCPAWCDRVLLSKPARELIHNPPPLFTTSPSAPRSPSPRRKKIEASSVLYDIIGRNACMGDHKPVFLLFNLKSNARIPIPRYSSYGIYDEVAMHTSRSSSRSSSRFRRRDHPSRHRSPSPWMEAVASGSPPGTPLFGAEETLTLPSHHGPKDVLTSPLESSASPLPVDHQILTRYIEIKDCNRVKLFKETTV